MTERLRTELQNDEACSTVAYSWRSTVTRRSVTPTAQRGACERWNAHFSLGIGAFRSKF